MQALGIPPPPLGDMRLRGTPNTPRNHRGNNSGPPPPPPPPQGPGPWLCDQPYKHFVKETPVDTWEKCNDVVERHDERVCRAIKEEITFLMVVAGLLLAVVTGFTVESYKLLLEDKQDTMSVLLVEVVRLLNDTSVRGHAGLPKPFMPDHRHVVVNQLWFLSTILSLVAVMIGTFCLQWISAFLRAAESNDRSASPTESLTMRQLRYEGMVGWGVRRAPEALLLIVQLSLALFTAGLVYFLWGVNHSATLPALTAAATAGFLLYLANFMPFLQSLVAVFFPKSLTLPQCPYKSPTSWLIQSTCSLPALVFNSKPFQILFCADHTTVVGRFSEWLMILPRPFTDYLWKKHDSMCAELRESWGACSRARFLGLGLSSAIDILVLEPDAINIIGDSMQSLAQTFKDAEIWKNTFEQTLTSTELDIIRVGGPRNCFIQYFPRTLYSLLDLQTFINSIRNDFLYALLLQNLVLRSQQLNRILLPHRIELYIRITISSLFLKNSTSPPGVPDSRLHEFGSSLTFPLENGRQVGNLDKDMMFQLLKCIDRLLSVNYGQEVHFVVAAIIIRVARFDGPQLSTGNGEGVEDEHYPADPRVHESEAHQKQVDDLRLTGSLRLLSDQMRRRLLMIPSSCFKNQYIPYAMKQLMNEPSIWDEVMDNLGPLHRLLDGVDLRKSNVKMPEYRNTSVTRFRAHSAGVYQFY